MRNGINIFGMAPINGVLRASNNITGDISTSAQPLVVLNSSEYSVAYAGTGCSDFVLYDRALSTAEIQQLADPSNTMLSGLILPPRRMVWPVAVAGGDKTVSISAALDVTVALEGFPIAVNRTIEITG